MGFSLGSSSGSSPYHAMNNETTSILYFNNLGNVHAGQKKPALAVWYYSKALAACTAAIRCDHKSRDLPPDQHEKAGF